MGGSAPAIPGGRAATFLTGGAGVPSKLGADEGISRPGATKLG